MLFCIDLHADNPRFYVDVYVDIFQCTFWYYLDNFWLAFSFPAWYGLLGDHHDDPDCVLWSARHRVRLW